MNSKPDRQDALQLRDALDFGNLAAARLLLGLNGQQGPLLAAGDHQLTVEYP